MRGLVGGAAAVTVGSTGINYSTREAKAIAPALVALGIGGSVAVGWALREYEVLGSDSPPEGLTADALNQQIHQMGTARSSQNKSTLVDNRNIVDGIENTAYTEGKIAAIEALNADKSQSAVETAALEAVGPYEYTIVNNFAKSWDETVNEFIAAWNVANSHPDVTASNVFQHYYEYEPGGNGYSSEPATTSQTHTIENHPDDVTSLAVEGGSGMSQSDLIRLDPGYPSDPTSATDTFGLYLTPSGSDDVTLLVNAEWNPVFDEIRTAFDNARNGLLTWVGTVYSDVQSGEIDLTDLTTPRDRAAMMADEETIAPAIADLIALNQHVDPEREATITLNNDEITLVGTFARTANPSGEPLEAGSTYDPASDLTGDVYFTYDTTLGEGVWSDHEVGVDGGAVTFTSEPIKGVTYSIATTAGETATVQATDFMHDDAAGVWETDISAQVDNAITEIDSVTYTQPDDAEPSYETILLEQPFTIEKFVDSDGNEVDSATFEQSGEPQDDSNYITQEEWDDLEQQNQELIEKYEESQNDGSLGGGGGFLSDIGTDSNSTIIAAVAVVLVAFGLLGNN